MAKSKNRITKERHASVVAMGICPNCKDHRIVTATRWVGGSDALDRKRKYGGSYLCCGGELGHRCWHMTKDGSDRILYENFGDG